MTILFCPRCGHDENVARDATSYKGKVYRRRKCGGCDKIFTTTETVNPVGTKIPHRATVKANQKAQERQLTELMGKMVRRDRKILRSTK